MAHIWASRVLHRGEGPLVPHSVVGLLEQDGEYLLRRTTAKVDGGQNGPGSKWEEGLRRWAKRPWCVDRPRPSAPRGLTTAWPPDPATCRLWEGQEKMQLVLNCRTYAMERNTQRQQTSLGSCGEATGVNVRPRLDRRRGGQQKDDHDRGGARESSCKVGSLALCALGSRMSGVTAIVIKAGLVCSPPAIPADDYLFC